MWDRPRFASAEGQVRSNGVDIEWNNPSFGITPRGLVLAGRRRNRHRPRLDLLKWVRRGESPGQRGTDRHTSSTGLWMSDANEEKAEQ